MEGGACGHGEIAGNCRQLLCKNIIKHHSGGFLFLIPVFVNPDTSPFESLAEELSKRTLKLRIPTCCQVFFEDQIC